jgi:hypothetical protein
MNLDLANQPQSETICMAEVRVNWELASGLEFLPELFEYALEYVQYAVDISFGMLN